MALARRTVQDFMTQVNARTNTLGTIVYSTLLNNDGSVQISKNGVVLFPKVYWGMGTGVAVTDLNISGDSLDIVTGPQVASADAQQFINSLN